MLRTGVSSFGVLLLSYAASAQAAMVATTWTARPMWAAFEYEPAGFPVAPASGWNFSTIAQNGVYPYNPPLYDANAMPYTSMSGAKVTTHFYGWGATVWAWATNGTRVTAELRDEDDRRVSDMTTTNGGAGDILTVSTTERVNRWQTLTVTLNEGELQLRNITLSQNVDLNYPNVELSPYVKANVTWHDFKDVHPYYERAAGEWVAQKMFEPGVVDNESPHIVGSPGASLRFRTWPNATVLNIWAQLGHKMGDATYRITPPPYGMTGEGEVKRTLRRPIEGYGYLGREILDPKLRYDVEVTNSDSAAELRFAGAFYSLATDDAASWEPGIESEGYVPEEADDDESAGGKNGDGANKDGPEEDSGPNVGAIAGGVVGGVAGAAIIAGLLFFFGRRRHPRHNSDEDKFIVDDTAMAAAAPYVQPPPQHNGPSPSSTEKTRPSSEQQLLMSHSGHRTSFSVSQGGMSGFSSANRVSFHPPQEADAGPLNLDSVPPSYNPAWAGPGGPPAPASHSSQTFSRVSGLTAEPQPMQTGPLHLHHAGYDHKALSPIPQEQPGTEEPPRPEAGPLPEKRYP